MTGARSTGTDRRIVPACELIGSEGQFRVPGGRTIYDAVMFNDATARGSRVRLARLAVTERGVRQVNRWIDWDAPIEVLSHEDDES